MIELPQIDDATGLERVHSRDRVWLQDSPANLMVINAIWTLDHISVEDLRRVWQERVLDAEIDGERPYARFFKMVVARGKKPYWRRDPDFDLARHIFTVEDPRLRSPEGVQAYLGEHASRPLPIDRPPWQLRLIPDVGGGQSAVIIRLHHVLGDGMGLMPVLFSLMDVEEGAQRPPKTRGVTGKRWQVVLKTVLMAGPLLTARALRPADRSLYHGPELSGEKRFAWSPPIALDEVKAIKNALSATVNDVLMTVVSGGLGRYAGRRGGEVPDGLRIFIPVNVRHPDARPTMDNRFGAVIVDLPIADADGRRRLERIKQRMDALKRSVEPFVYYGTVSSLLKALPGVASRALLDFLAAKCSVVLSNVPGPQEPLTVAGRRVRGMLFWVPQRANIGLGISILSFSGEVRVGIIADTALVEKPAELIDDMLAELEDLAALV